MSKITSILLIGCFILFGKGLFGQNIDLEKHEEILPFIKLENALKYFNTEYETIPNIEILNALEKEVYSYTDSLSFFVKKLNKSFTIKRELAKVKPRSDSLIFYLDSIKFHSKVKPIWARLDFGKIKTSLYHNSNYSFIIIEISKVAPLTDYSHHFFVLDIKNKTVIDFLSLSLKNKFFIPTKNETVFFPIYREKKIEVYDGKLKHGVIKLHRYSANEK
jgi:hypothetical protein